MPSLIFIIGFIYLTEYFFFQAHWPPPFYPFMTLLYHLTRFAFQCLSSYTYESVFYHFDPWCFTKINSLFMTFASQLCIYGSEHMFHRATSDQYDCKNFAFIFELFVTHLVEVAECALALSIITTGDYWPTLSVFSRTFSNSLINTQNVFESIVPILITPNHWVFDPTDRIRVLLPFQKSLTIDELWPTGS